MNSHGISIALTGRFYRGKRASRQVLTNIIQLKVLREAKNLKDIQKIYNTGTGFDRADALLKNSLNWTRNPGVKTPCRRNSEKSAMRG
jgi:hypothetical protein